VGLEDAKDFTAKDKYIHLQVLSMHNWLAGIIALEGKMFGVTDIFQRSELLDSRDRKRESDYGL
jgi:hypothetical protein